jgi:hypothetical protein
MIVPSTEKNTTTVITESVNTENKETIVESKAIEKPPVIDVSSMELTQENIDQVLTELFEPNQYIGAFIYGNDIEVTYNPGENVWDEKDLVRRSANQAVKVYTTLFKNPSIQQVIFYTQTNLTDSKGNTTAETVINFRMSKENARDINWPKFTDMVKTDYKALIRVADNTTIHPAISNKL